jgi:hypothetical protein
VDAEDGVKKGGSMKRFAFAFLLLIALFAWSQTGTTAQIVPDKAQDILDKVAQRTDSIPKCNALMKVYAGQIDRQAQSGMTPSKDPRFSLERTASSTVFSTLKLLQMHADLDACTLVGFSQVGKCSTQFANEAAYWRCLDSITPQGKEWNEVRTYVDRAIADRFADYWLYHTNVAREMDKGLNIDDQEN